MIIDSTPFENFPIEFKEINPEDFILPSSSNNTTEKGNEFIIENDGQKIVISPNNQGYINDEIQRNIDLEHKNTVVINAAVGQGKSYAIIQTVKRYYEKMQNEEQKYLIIVASPFVSLVKQYCNDIANSGVPSEQIFNYAELGRGSGTRYLNRSVQVVTANTLLGNPGEDAFKNSDAKREYLNRLISHSKDNEVKVVFIYDEIHDSYHNFRMEYVFNLWKWRDVIHKNFILSATYNEASKVVIEYLAELTDKRIKIIESTRIRFPNKQSSLHLHFSPAYNFTNEVPEIKDLIHEIINKGKQIDILCYSKSLAKSLINPKEEVGKLLKKAFGEVKDCTSELVSGQRGENTEPTNQYDNNKCNVGTNFKTGVSIKKRNHAFVIIMPPRATKLWFRNRYGIFSGGINSVIQALARQRIKGEIHIVLSKPEQFDYSSLEDSGVNLEQRLFLGQWYNDVKHYDTPENPVRYIKMNNQESLLQDFYNNKLYANVEAEIELVSSLERTNLVKLDYPSYKQFKLENGEEYLANEFPFFGEDISAYVTYASLANQFINCRLKEIRYTITLFFKEGQIQKDLLQFFNQYLGTDYFYSAFPHMNYKMVYLDIRRHIFSDFDLKYFNGNKWIKISPYQNKEFENQFIAFVSKMYYGKDFHYRDLMEDYSTDIPYTRSMYFLDCIKFAENINVQTIEASQEVKDKIVLYQLLAYFRRKLIASIHEYNARREHYFCISNNYWEGFFDEEDIEKFNKLESLINSDPLLDSNIFEFKRRVQEKSNLKSKIKAFYNILREDFIEPIITEDRIAKINYKGKRRHMVKVSSVKTFPFTKNTTNLVTPAEYINLYN